MVKKAIIPAAGLGTRFLPATKTVPKEMLTIVDTPIIFYVVEEAVRAGIEDIILIQGRGKSAIEDFFDTSYELEDKLAKDGKEQLLERLRKIREMANIISVRQKQPLGLGHAVLCGKSIVGNSPFAVLLGDEIMVTDNGKETTTGVLTRHYNEVQSSVVAVMKVDDKDVSKYGIADVSKDLGSGLFQVKGFVEKPSVEKAPSRWALPGRYVFSPKIFEHIEKAKPGKLGEIQLTDAMNSLAQSEKFYASTFESKRYDAGDKLGYLMANVEMSFKNPELSEDMKKYIKELAQKI